MALKCLQLVPAKGIHYAYLIRYLMSADTVQRGNLDFLPHVRMALGHSFRHGIGAPNLCQQAAKYMVEAALHFHLALVRRWPAYLALYRTWLLVAMLALVS